MVNANNEDNNDDGRKVGFSILTGLNRLVGIPEYLPESHKDKEDNHEERKDKGDFPTSIDTIIFDFDGTLTDTWKGAKPFIAGYKEDLKAILKEHRGVDGDFDMLWDRIGNELFTYLRKVDWIYEGNAVSTARGDPYLECNAIATSFFGWLSLFTGEIERSAILQKLYTDNYPKTITVFREDARKTLALAMHFNVCIATNSDTARVREKLMLLNSRDPAQDDAQKEVQIDYSTLPLFGNAQKYKIDKDWQMVPEQVEAEGLHRPVLLRRKPYFDVLEKIRSSYSTEFSRMFVIGDNYELDLALPQALGMAIGYIDTKRRQAYESKAVEKYDRGFVMEM